MRLPVYLDYQATTPLDARVFEEMKPYFLEHFGNPSNNTHEYGWRAKAAVEKARKQVAVLLGVSEAEIFFTSGATESNNLVIFGIAATFVGQGKHLVVGGVEHKSVLKCFERLEQQGFEVTYLKVGNQGEIELSQVENALRSNTVLVSVMGANNEVGTLYPISKIGQMCRKRGIFFHSDVAQMIGHFSVPASEVDFLSMSAHKIYGPKGVGAVYIRKAHPALPLLSQQLGGGQEKGVRSGTLNVPGIVGLGKACELISQHREEESRRLEGLRDDLWGKIKTQLKGVYLNGSQQNRLPNNLNFRIDGIRGSVLMTALQDIACSGGAACGSVSPEPSHVLLAMGYTPAQAESSIRVSLGRQTTQDEVNFAAESIVRTAKRIREEIRL